MTATMKPLALVTGVGPGTGASIARRFAEGGYRVAMLARDASRLAALEAEIPDSVAVTCDVGDPAALAKAVAQVGPAKVVVHNDNTIETGVPQGSAFLDSALGALGVEPGTVPAYPPAPHCNTQPSRPPPGSPGGPGRRAGRGCRCPAGPAPPSARPASPSSVRA